MNEEKEDKKSEAKQRADLEKDKRIKSMVNLITSVIIVLSILILLYGGCVTLIINTLEG